MCSNIEENLFDVVAREAIKSGDVKRESAYHRLEVIVRLCNKAIAT